MNSRYWHHSKHQLQTVHYHSTILTVECTGETIMISTDESPFYFFACMHGNRVQVHEYKPWWKPPGNIKFSDNLSSTIFNNPITIRCSALLHQVRSDLKLLPGDMACLQILNIQTNFTSVRSYWNMHTLFTKYHFEPLSTWDITFSIKNWKHEYHGSSIYEGQAAYTRLKLPHTKLSSLHSLFPFVPKPTKIVLSHSNLQFCS